ncbi:hypothetical protein [Methylobacter sp. YRD-M1]|uniref:hypothetical protein n=1 Tax=Methylobacter sp. YRD-M1 TaxID=2911520 RepID=UPI00227B1DC0|nr:hypothetical protein [Methylobacter sp. YRD-M1]WAK01899.1 hypothetical protein LZ558_19105 [Methylobacter sp. YRD-M1]
MMLLAASAGCKGNDQPAAAANSKVLKTQTDALEKARAVEQAVLDAAAQQRQRIEQSTQ